MVYHLNAPPRTLHKLVHNAQSQPGAVPARGEEGLEQPQPGFFRNTRTGIPDIDTAFALAGRDGDEEYAAVGHGFQSVGEQVPEDLPEVVGIDIETGQDWKAVSIRCDVET